MRIAFGDCVLDSDTREVLRSGKTISLPPKAFQLLQVLIRGRPKAISKENLHRLLWPDTFVSDANLTKLVAELRAALGDDARKPRIIRTVQRFGYAFPAEAHTVAASRPSSSGGAPIYRLICGSREIGLAFGENLLGRDEDSVVWIDEPSVSRRHARIVIGEKGAVLEDLGSKNGTCVRGQRIRGPVELGDKDLFSIGSTSMILRILKRPASTE